MRVAVEKIVQHGRQLVQNFTNKGAEKIGWKGREFTRFQHGQQHKVLLRSDAWASAKSSKHDTSYLSKYLARSHVKSVAADLRRKAAWQLAGNLVRRKPNLPIYAFVGFALAAKAQPGEKGNDSICSEIRSLFSTKSQPTLEGEVVDHFKLEDYEFGDMIAKGCNAAVYEARLRTDDHYLSDMESDDEDEEESEGLSGLNLVSQLVAEEEEEEEEYEMASLSEEEEEYEMVSLSEEEEDELEIVFEEETEREFSSGVSSLEHYNLAVKMMFNYDTSNAQDILRTMEKEAVPAKMAAVQGEMLQWQNGSHVKKKKRQVPPHPNIVDMQQVFVGQVPQLPEGMTEYPLALPNTLNPDGCGRSHTMFLVMRRYSTTLRDYLKNHQPSIEGATRLLLQLVEGIVHLNHHQVAHRDLKTDNILLNTMQGGVENVQLVLSDFGCCLADGTHGLRLPFPTDEVSRGGNANLMAPEISLAVPGCQSFLDYRNSDLWAAGAMAYEIFGAKNPFYTSGDARRLDSATYRESDLPPLPEHTPINLQRIVQLMLVKDAKKRPPPSAIANLLHLVLWAPQAWRQAPPSLQALTDWLLSLVAEVKCRRLSSSLGLPGQGSEVSSVEHQLKETFLARVDLMELFQDVWSLFCLNCKA